MLRIKLLVSFKITLCTVRCTACAASLAHQVFLAITTPGNYLLFLGEMHLSTTTTGVRFDLLHERFDTCSLKDPLCRSGLSEQVRRTAAEQTGVDPGRVPLVQVCSAGGAD